MIARVLLVLALVAMPLQALDDAVRADAQAARQPWMEAPMRFASSGSRPLLVVGAAAALLSGTMGRALVAEGLVALVPVNVLVEVLKWTTWRARPDGTHRHNNAAFPSSHAANAFAVAVVLARRWRRSAWAAFPLAALVAWSRVYLNRHWFTDVIAGAVLGALVAWWTVSAWRAWRTRAHARSANASS